MLICLVGGAVRDMLLGREIHDRDYLVLGSTPGEFTRRFPQAQSVGKAFPVYLVDHDEYAFPRGADCPVCCCAFGTNDLLNDLSADLLSRDLTINALALPLPDHPALPTKAEAWDMVVGAPTALDDLRQRVLRPVGPKSLAEDPLRVFRAARFAAQLADFEVHEELRQALRQASADSLTTDLSAERVGAELRKALRAPRPGNFLRLLADTGCLSPWFAELEGANQIPAGPLPYHDESVLEHIAQVMDRLAGDELAVWMALTHDLGKVLTPADRHPSHHGHDRLGEAPAEALSMRLALPNRFHQAARLAARWHMTAGNYPDLRPGTRVDLLAEVHAARLTDELFRLVEADKGQDHGPLARRDLAAMLEVHLPGKWRDLGEESGQRLRRLRSEALSRGRHG